MTKKEMKRVETMMKFDEVLEEMCERLGNLAWWTVMEDHADEMMETMKERFGKDIVDDNLFNEWLDETYMDI